MNYALYSNQAPPLGISNTENLIRYGKLDTRIMEKLKSLTGVKKVIQKFIASENCCRPLDWALLKKIALPVTEELAV